MEIICEQSQKDEEMYLQKFAFCGSTEVFKNNISSLAAMAEPEKFHRRAKGKNRILLQGDGI